MTWRSLLLAGAALALTAMAFHPQAYAQHPAAAPNPLGMEVRHIHIWVTDVERTKAFYREKLGFPVANETPGAVVEFSGLWFGKWRGQGPIPTGGITIGIAAKSVEAAYNELKKRGVSIPNPPAPARGEYAVMLKDPDGYEIEIEGPK